MVQNCLKAHSLLAKLGIEVTVADARFCKPLDIKLLRQLCKHHSFLITVEEGSIGGFGSHVAEFIAVNGLLDGRIKVIGSSCVCGKAILLGSKNILDYECAIHLLFITGVKIQKLTNFSTCLNFLVGSCKFIFSALIGYSFAFMQQIVYFSFILF